MPSKRQQRDQERHEQASMRIAATALLSGETITVEECAKEQYGRLFGSTHRWAFTVGHLPPSEVLMLDPRKFPEGTELAIIHPGRLRPPLDMWLTYRDLAPLLYVSTKRLTNLVAEHKLERRYKWTGRGRDRRRLTFLPPVTVRRLAELTGCDFMKPSDFGDASPGKK